MYFFIRNQSQHSKDYEATKYLMRPSHADYTAFEKYGGFQDYRGGGHFREELQLLLLRQVPFVSANFKTKGITIATHIASCKGVEDEPFATTEEALLKQADKLNNSYFPTISNQAEQEMVQVIEQAHSNGDSVGGILETAIVNMPAGIGEPFLVRLKVCWHIFCSVCLP